jgi:ferritin-like metal-binding protein YciE
MENQNLKELIKKGFAAMKSGSQIAAEATDEIQNDVKNEELKNALEHGNEQSKVWLQRIERGLEQAGGGAEQENEILKAHFEVGKEIRGQAADDVSRDLGIIASGQMALHYWIASFGTQASYAGATGMDQTQQEMQNCLNEAKQADENLTQIAKSILAA